jgi:glycosyltransferase involved in cell wall biosynthesis
MMRCGTQVSLISATEWNEGGSTVALQQDCDRFVRGVRTFGRHPNLFVYDPVGLWRAIRAQQFDVVDIHEEPVSLAAAEAQLILVLAGRHASFALYSAQNLEKRYPIPFRWLERLALRRAAAVHTCNAAAVLILRAKGFQGLVANLGLGIDVDRFTPAPLAASNQPLRVGYVGRLEPHKGVHVLVDAVATIPSCSLEIVGEGSQRAALEAQVAASAARDRITFTGYVEQTRIAEVYLRFDVLAVPSLETERWVEQFGRVALESMASGVPVVASRSGALPEVVGDTGLLVAPGDAHALATALARLGDDPTERRRLGKLARAHAEQFSWDAIARRQLDLYAEMRSRGS